MPIRKKEGRIFVSYRRTDSQGVAGRLSDTLENYFGRKRIFRDIEDITGGAEFGQVIETSLQSADAAIVLIGPNWLNTADEDGKRRLDAADDWVAQEIAAAIDMNIPVFPVLIEDTPMPRHNELPEKLQPLVKFNAITITDRNWHNDVRGLGKIISFNIPSASERILNYAQLAICLLLGLSLAFSTAVVSLNELQRICMNSADTNWCSFWQIFMADKSIAPTQLILLSQSGIPFIAIAASVLILFNIVNLVSEDKRRFIYYSALSGTIGSLFFFTIQIFLRPAEEPQVIYFGSALVIALMFSFMNLSGFKPK